MKAADVMTPRVITIDPDSSVADAARRMLENRISGMPVVDAGGRLVGMISEGDLLHRAELGTERRPRSWWLRKVGDAMTQSVVSVGPDTPIDEVVRILEGKRIKRVPVVQDGRVLGIVSRANLLQVLASGTRLAEPSPDDRTLRERVLAALGSEPWAPRVPENVVVKDGIVHLWGAVSTESQRQALRVAAETVPGVRGVEDHITVADPISEGAVAW